MSKVISIRLSDTLYNYIMLIKRMRQHTAKLNNLNDEQETTTQIIEIAILRFYNETCDYWLQENDLAYKDFVEYVEIMSNK